jgi:DNA-dependent protein kinase catalytic subunit
MLLACRYQMLIILVAVYEMQQLKVTALTTPNATSIKRLTSDTLLKSLLDEDPTIRLMAQNFWLEKANMPTSTIDRMVLILEKMYSPQTEKEYLSYSTNLLLEKTSKSPDYNRFIYENPLSECTFREYNLSADWRRRHEMMTPLFVDTINSFTDSYDNTFGASANQSFAHNLRATQQQSLQFQPTQEAGSGGAKTTYNWLTQSSVDTFQASFANYSFSESQSALLFNTGKKSAKNVDSLTSNSNANESDQDILRLRRRFAKDKTVAQHRFFARKQIDKKNKEEEFKKQLKLKRSSHVEKYRQYRIGDFPDIQIKFSEIIAPIQALAQRDSQIAMILFESLFGSILYEVSFLKDESEAMSIIKSIEQNINLMLTSSDSYTPNFIACLLEIGLKHAKNFRLDVSSISSACLNSLQQPLGIILLEEYLILNETNKNDSSPPSNKRIKYSDDAASEVNHSYIFYFIY